MPLIYFKLNTGQTYFRDEDLEIELNISVPAAVTDYTNITPAITEGLNAGIIIQITEAEFYGLAGGPPIVINPGYLITINSFISGCPNPNSVFYTYYSGKWWGILWSQIKSCITAGTTSERHLFTVGIAVAPYPVPGDNKIILPGLIGKTTQDIILLINGTELYPQDNYDSADWVNTDYYTFDSPLGTITRDNVSFSNKDIVSLLIL